MVTVLHKRDPLCRLEFKSLSLSLFSAPDFSIVFSQIFTIFSAAAFLSLFGSAFLDIHKLCFLHVLDCKIR